MGCCCCKVKEDDDTSLPRPTRTPTLSALILESQLRTPQPADTKVVDQLILEMLTVGVLRFDTTEPSPDCLVILRALADKEEGWILMVSSMVKVIPLENTFGPTTISILLDDCPLPSKESVIKVTTLFKLSEERATTGDVNVLLERNLCVTLGCIAEKLVGPNSAAIFTIDTLNYLVAFLRPKCDPRIVLFALIALEKFALTTENKMTIKKRLERFKEHPLLELEKYADSKDYVWRQVGFCATWALDNLFIIEGRKLSYEVVDMTNISALLNSHDVSEYLQISSTGLEARCDSYSFESVRCTFQVDEGCWYYESTIVTPGVMQIGYATKNSHFLNDEGYGIGDDLFSMAYDGCRKITWYNAKPTPVKDVPAWSPGDVIGCLIDLNTKELIFSINGKRINPCKDIFETTRHGFFAAASFMMYQQCQFNFGNRPFKFPPKDRVFSSFNDHGVLTEDQKMVIPRRIYLEKLRCSSVKEDSCTLCFDASPCCILEPCGHRDFCAICTSQLRECPLCRADILNVRKENT